MAKMWDGRFSKALDQQADDFNSSIHFDSRMFRQDIKGSMAHAAMLAAKGIIGNADADAIITELGSQNFPRVKIGVGGKPDPSTDLADWVLSGFTSAEEKALSVALENAADATWAINSFAKTAPCSV